MEYGFERLSFDILVSFVGRSDRILARFTCHFDHLLKLRWPIDHSLPYQLIEKLIQLCYLSGQLFDILYLGSILMISDQLFLAISDRQKGVN